LYLARTGRKAGAAEELERIADLPSHSPVVAYRMALVYELLGNRSQALKWLQDAVDGDYSRREIEAEPDLVGLRADPRYHRMAAALQKSADSTGNKSP
jgi:hypothetical protein